MTDYVAAYDQVKAALKDVCQALEKEVKDAEVVYKAAGMVDRDGNLIEVRWHRDKGSQVRYEFADINEWTAVTL